MKGASYQPSTSVLIVNFNGRHHLEGCLAALGAQEQVPTEIIVVDNDSSDDSVDYLERCHPYVKLVALTTNAGFAGGNIAGYEVATGEYIVLLNNDTKPLQDWLKRLSDCAQALPDVGIVASHMTDWEGKRTDTAGDGCSVTGRGFKLHEGTDTDLPIEPGYVFSACAGAALYKRTMLEEVGFFDEHFFMNGEDTDLAFRARLAGWRTYLCARAVVRHRIGASQQLYSSRHVFYSTRNHVWLFVRCMPTRLLFKHLPAFLLQTLVYLVSALSRRQGIAYLSGLCAAATGLPHALRQRREIQASLRISRTELEQELTSFSHFLKNKLRQGRVPHRR